MALNRSENEEITGLNVVFCMSRGHGMGGEGIYGGGLETSRVRGVDPRDGLRTQYYSVIYSPPHSPLLMATSSLRQVPIERSPFPLPSPSSPPPFPLLFIK